jgi:hypothetical protein
VRQKALQAAADLGVNLFACVRDAMLEHASSRADLKLSRPGYDSEPAEYPDFSGGHLMRYLLLCQTFWLRG